MIVIISDGSVSDSCGASNFTEPRGAGPTASSLDCLSLIVESISPTASGSLRDKQQHTNVNTHLTTKQNQIPVAINLPTNAITMTSQQFSCLPSQQLASELQSNNISTISQSQYQRPDSPSLMYDKHIYNTQQSQNTDISSSINQLYNNNNNSRLYQQLLRKSKVNRFDNTKLLHAQLLQQEFVAQTDLSPPIYSNLQNSNQHIQTDQQIYDSLALSQHPSFEQFGEHEQSKIQREFPTDTSMHIHLSQLNSPCEDIDQPVNTMIPNQDLHYQNNGLSHNVSTNGYEVLRQEIDEHPSKFNQMSISTSTV